MDWISDFDEATRHSFAYLTQLGYEPRSEHSGNLGSSVRYVRADGSEVSVVVCPIRVEADVDVACADGQLTSLYELQLMFPNVALPRTVHSIYGAYLDSDKLRAFVSILAEQFRLLGVPLLAGELSWEAVTEWRREQQQAKQVAELSQSIAKAFAEKRWADVISGVRQLGDQAGQLNLKRSAYAEKQQRCFW